MAFEELGFGGGAEATAASQIPMEAIMFWIGFIFVLIVLFALVFFIMYVLKHNVIIEIWREMGNKNIEIRRFKARKVMEDGVGEYRMMFKSKKDALKPEDNTFYVYKEGRADKLILFQRNDQEYDPVVFQFDLREPFITRKTFNMIRRSINASNVPIKGVLLKAYQFVPFTNVASSFKPIPQSALLWGMTKLKEISKTFQSNKLNDILQIVIPVVMMGIFLVVVILLLQHMESFETNIMSQASSMLEAAKNAKLSTVPAAG